MLQASDQDKPRELTTLIHKDRHGWHKGAPRNCASLSTQLSPPSPRCLPCALVSLGPPTWGFPDSILVLTLLWKRCLLKQCRLFKLQLTWPKSCGRKLSGGRKELEEAGNKQARARGTNYHSWPPWREEGGREEWRGGRRSE